MILPVSIDLTNSIRVKKKQLLTLCLISITVLPLLSEVRADTILNLSPNELSKVLEEMKQKKPSLLEKTPDTDLLAYWKAFHQQIKEKTGISLGVAFTGLSQYSPGVRPQDNASGSDLDLLGKWTSASFWGGVSNIGFHLERRNKFTTLAPASFNKNIGSVIKTTQGFNQFNPALVELWWQHVFPTKKSSFRVGKIDIMSLMNTYAFKSQKLFFINQAFTGYPAVSRPSKALGGAASLALTDHYYVGYGLVDANGTNITSGFNTFGKGQYFQGVELGYLEKIDNQTGNNYHVFLWHMAARPQINMASDQGASIVLQHKLSNKLTPFFKWNLSRGTAANYKYLYTAGIGIDKPFEQVYSLSGIAVAYGKPANSLRGYETVVEGFYRIQLSPFIQLTPDIQLIKFKPTNSTSKLGAVFNLRWRLAG